MLSNKSKEKEYLVLTFNELEKLKVFIRQDDDLDTFFKTKKIVPINCTGAFVVRIKDDQIFYHCLKNSPFDKAPWSKSELVYFERMQELVEEQIYRKNIWFYIKKLFHAFLKKR
jgi:hypothetical protein